VEDILLILALMSIAISPYWAKKLGGFCFLLWSFLDKKKTME